jgi:hypothetical protein
VVASTGIEAAEEQAALEVTDIFDGLITARNRVLKGQRDGIQGAITNAHAPDEIINIRDVLLMRLWCKDK